AVSDDAVGLRVALGLDDDDDPVSRAELLASAVVSGQSTLCRAIRQLQAGEALLSEGNSLILRRYFVFRHRLAAPQEEEQLLAGLDTAVMESARRTALFAAGRPLAIPLSGGYDSRLIAISLKRLDYRGPMLAYSYGRGGNDEARVSQAVARRLGIPWHFVAYDPRVWQSWFCSPVRRGFYRRTHDLVTLPCVQEGPAWAELARRGAIGPDVVALPGYSGDLLAGSQIRPVLLEDHPFGEAEMVAFLEQKSYRYNRRLVPEGPLRRAIRARIAAVLTDLRLTWPIRTDDVVDVVECWVWQERVAKFVVAACRIYETGGGAWWMPLWDDGLVAFFSGVALEHRQGHRLYRRYVDARYQEVAGSAVDALPRYKQKWQGELPGLRTLLRPTKRAAFRLVPGLPQLDLYLRDPLQIYGILGLLRYLRLAEGLEHPNAYLVQDLLGLTSFDRRG
ncbi:MAG: hypothetical protein FJ125_06665, partial [Deltaproteobacteria bacterium]|nr:hypothetical protein [Deltaproteobacteria bacterium]